MFNSPTDYEFSTLINRAYQVLQTTIDSSTGKITCNIGFNTTETETIYQKCELWQQAGIITVPPNPKNKDACNCIILQSDTRPAIISTFDSRRQIIAKDLNPGEMAIYSIGDGTSTSQIRVKTDQIECKFDDSHYQTIKSDGIICKTDKMLVGSSSADDPVIRKSDLDAALTTINNYLKLLATHLHPATSGTTSAASELSGLSSGVNKPQGSSILKVS